MNDKSINSLISAYHDGELNAAERTEVERLLVSSPEARAELEAYQRVSQLMREAGRPKLSADLAPAVMQAIKQRHPRPAAKPTQKTSPASWVRWASLAAVAASLIIAVTITWRPGQPDQNIADNNPANVTTPDVPVNVVTPKPADNSNKPEIKIAGNKATPANNDVTAPQLVNLDPKEIPLEVIEDLKKAPPAKIVRFLKQSGKDVAVFHLMVLDTKPGLDSLQMILSAQQISGPRGENGASGVIAVYVEAKQDQLDRVIAEIQSENQKQFVALAVQSPVKEAAVKKFMKNQPTEVAAQQVPLKEDELKSVGVARVKSNQIEVARNSRSGSALGPVRAVGTEGVHNVSPMKKVLIVLEKVPESLMPKSAN